MKIIYVVAAFIILIGAEVLRVYYIMPFPGSQHDDTISLAYFINEYIIYFRILGWGLLLYGMYAVWGQISLSAKIILGIIFSVYIFIAVLFNYYFQADHIFYQPKNIVFLNAAESKVDPAQLILGVAMNGEAKAYPIEVIGYHHQVRDVVGGNSVMITYCTVCRTGRVYKPEVDGKPEDFRLVGMDHFNAMFEDSSTKSWWRQVSGEAVVGPRKGQLLGEIPSEQMSLRAWLLQYPDSKILQPDTLYKEGYNDLKKFDEGTIESGLERRDSLSWKDKSWVVGIQLGSFARAYDWNMLVAKHTINDTLNHESILLALEPDSTSFHTWNRDSLTFSLDALKKKLTDENTNSLWNWNGECVEGPLKGKRLKTIQSYQEFWHSWKTFHSRTSKYN